MPTLSTNDSLSSTSGFKFSLLLALALLTILFSMAGEAYAAIYYVSPMGDDTARGTSSAPWGTFAHAMTVLQPGDTLYLEDGTYTETLNISVSGTSSAYVTIKALNEGNAIVSTTYPTSPLYLYNHNYIEVDGINFRNSGVYDSNTNCATDEFGYDNVNGVNIAGADHIILRRVTAKGASGCNSAVIGLAGVTDSLLEDCAGSGQGRVVLNMNSCNNVTIRRGWLNWTGPDTGGGDTPNVTQVYDSSNVLMENNIGVNYTYDDIEFFTTWGHYSSISGNKFYGNIGYNAYSSVAGGMFMDSAECGNKVSGTIFSNNVAIVAGNGGHAAESVNADYNNGTVFINNTFVSPNSSGSGLLFSGRNACTAQQAAVANGQSNSFLNTEVGYAYGGNGASIYLLAHDYNNFYNVPVPYFDTVSLTHISLPIPGVHDQTLNSNYPAAIYGYGAYLTAPAVLKGEGANGSDIGANVIYEYVDGTLTNTPLWPWPMESRILAEFNVSPTWELYGGLWRTLDGTYSGDISVPPAPTPAESNIVFAIYGGREWYKSKSGVVYKAEIDYSGGATATTTAPISGTADPTLYQSTRYGNFYYNIPVTNGSYIVTLKFAEIYWDAPSKRVFNVSMQSMPVINNLDIFALVGKNAAYDVSVPVSVTNSILNINLSSIQDYACLSAMEIQSVLLGDFSDVSSTSNFYNYIEAIYKAGITIGCGNGNYCPSAGVTRDQMAAFIIRALYGENFTCTGGAACSTTTPIFNDVLPTDPSEATYFPYIQKLSELQITTMNGTYLPGEGVSRGQMAAFLVRALQVKAGQPTESFTYSQTPYFNDVPAGSTFFSYVQRLKDLGITTVTGTYGVNELVTRDQMAAFLSRAFLGMK